MKKSLFLLVVLSMCCVSLFGMESGECSAERQPESRLWTYWSNRPLFKQRLEDKVNLVYTERFENAIKNGTAQEVEEYVSNTDNLMEALPVYWREYNATIFHSVANMNPENYKQFLENVRTLMTAIPLAERRKIEENTEPITDDLIKRLVDNHMNTLEQIIAVKTNYLGGETAYAAISWPESKLELRELFDSNNPVARDALRPIVAENIRQILHERKVHQ